MAAFCWNWLSYATYTAVGVVGIGCAAHTEPNYKAHSYSSVDNVYKAQHKSDVPLGLGTGVPQLLLTLFTLRELTKVIALYIELASFPGSCVGWEQG